jgi:hypothetical protein
MASALFPIMMTNPFYVTFAGMSGAMWGMAYIADLFHSFNSLFLPKSKENRSLQRDIAPAKLAERSTLKLVTPVVSKDAGHTAKIRKINNHINNHKKTNHKA